MKPKVLVMSGYGINCESESKHAWERAGAEAEIVHINDLISGERRMDEYDILMFPGGFSYGDDIGSGYAFANRLRNNLWQQLLSFIADGKPILGVCNGFQIMTSLGLFTLPDSELGEPRNALLANTHDRYECRWVRLKRHGSRCIFTADVDRLHVPIAHGEGRFHCSPETLKALQENEQVVFTYCGEDGTPAEGEFPTNPNGALADIAAICDATGRLLGMMPHPERALFTHQAPDYHLRKEHARRKGEDLPKLDENCLRIFTNAVAYAKTHAKRGMEKA